MADKLRIACIQMNGTASEADCIEKADGLVARAAATGADVVVLPEKWNGFGPDEIYPEAAEPLGDGTSFEAMAGWARTHGITLIGGSITEQLEGQEKFGNTCVVFDPDGEIKAIYRKIHMFDVDVAGFRYRESDTQEPGLEPALTSIDGWHVGLTICYDLRFPELYRIEALRGAELILVPAAFTMFTGKDHWELLLRARAVENHLYIAGCNQIGSHGEGKSSYGRSMIVDPWGVVLAAAPDEECVITAELDRGRLAGVREQLPALANRRPDAYHWPAEA